MKLRETLFGVGVGRLLSKAVAGDAVLGGPGILTGPLVQQVPFLYRPFLERCRHSIGNGQDSHLCRFRTAPGRDLGPQVDTTPGPESTAQEEARQEGAPLEEVLREGEAAVVEAPAPTPAPKRYPKEKPSTRPHSVQGECSVFPSDNLTAYNTSRGTPCRRYRGGDGLQAAAKVGTNGQTTRSGRQVKLTDEEGGRGAEGVRV